MPAIASLRIENFRNLKAIDISLLDNGLNIFFGNNGSGKTSLIESIYYLSIGKSFRSSNNNRLIKDGTSKLNIFALLKADEDRLLAIGAERHATGAAKARMADEDVSALSAIAHQLPLRLINSQAHQLLESGPAFRRKFLDWGLFYQEHHRFLPAWKLFERALKQRNLLLKEKAPLSEVKAWTEELVKHALKLHELRVAYVKEFAPLLEETLRQLLPLENLTIGYYAGWRDGAYYSQVMADNYQEDYRLCHTQFGPHRADLNIEIEGIPAKYFLSRGQQKLLICAMILAQGNLLLQKINKGLVYLVDDLASELDAHSKAKILTLLAQQKAQIFITGIDGKEIYDLVDRSMTEVRVFHVEHGHIRHCPTDLWEMACPSTAEALKIQKLAC